MSPSNKPASDDAEEVHSNDNKEHSWIAGYTSLYISKTIDNNIIIKLKAGFTKNISGPTIRLNVFQIF